MSDQQKKIISDYQSKNTTETFDKKREKFKFQRYKHLIEANFLKKTITKLQKKEIKVLDVACGTGRMLPEVFSLSKKIKYTGLDTSKEMTKHLLEKAKKLDVEKSLNLVYADATKMPFVDGQFDVVYSFHLLWHLPQDLQVKIIREMIRVTKQGGYVVFDVLNKNFLWEKAKKKKTEGIYKFSLDEIKRIIKKAPTNIEKLNDFPIKTNFLYKLTNTFNYLRFIIPLSLFHFFYVRIKK